MIRLSFLRFKDLQARNIVKSWPQLKRLIEKYSFPKGRMISPNIRVWTETEIQDYVESCPIEGPPPRGVAKKRRGRPRKTDTTESATA
jgi:predicted DNA-binding transcriptional regulator AlpA